LVTSVFGAAVFGTVIFGSVDSGPVFGVTIVGPAAVELELEVELEDVLVAVKVSVCDWDGGILMLAVSESFEPPQPAISAAAATAGARK
jgi:hypothetical protein